MPSWICGPSKKAEQQNLGRTSAKADCRLEGTGGVELPSLGADDANLIDVT